MKEHTRYIAEFRRAWKEAIRLGFTPVTYPGPKQRYYKAVRAFCKAHNIPLPETDKQIKARNRRAPKPAILVGEDVV